VGIEYAAQKIRTAAVAAIRLAAAKPRPYIGGMTTTIYGIKNCDTMKKAFVWLDGHKVKYTFHDYKTSGIDKAKLESWVAAQGWEVLLNRGGTTFRKLPDADKDGLTAKKAIALMLAQPSMIKRPVLEYPGGLLVGFKPEHYAAVFK
jgi:arsenate reductase